MNMLSDRERVQQTRRLIREWATIPSARAEQKVDEIITSALGAARDEQGEGDANWFGHDEQGRLTVNGAAYPFLSAGTTPEGLSRAEHYAAWLNERVSALVEQRLAELEAESEGRLRALNEKAEESRQNWIRAERAEQERDKYASHEAILNNLLEQCRQERDEIIDAVQAETKLPSRVASVVADTIRAVCDAEKNLRSENEALRRIEQAAQRVGSVY